MTAHNTMYCALECNHTVAIFGYKGSPCSKLAKFVTKFLKFSLFKLLKNSLNFNCTSGALHFNLFHSYFTNHQAKISFDVQQCNNVYLNPSATFSPHIAPSLAKMKQGMHICGAFHVNNL